MITKERVFTFIPKINLLLTISAIIFLTYLAFKIVQPYRIVTINPREIKIKPLGLINTESLASKGAMAFDEGLFRKQLFSYAARKKVEPGKGGFILLGVSLGQKKLAMIRDARENKDYYCAEGDIILGLRVKEISKDRVVLEKDNESIELSR